MGSPAPGAGSGPRRGEDPTSISALLPALRDELPALLDDVGRALAEVDPDYERFLCSERFTVIGAAQVAVEGLVDAADRRLAGGPATEDSTAELKGPSEAALTLFEQAGRDHFRRERPLRALLMAYQVGGRVAWRHLAAVAVREGLPSDALAALAEGVFRTVDRLSAVTTTGYLLEQEESSGMREQMRISLAEHLVGGGADRPTLERLSRSAGWPLPAEAAVVFLRGDKQSGPIVMGRLTTRCLQLHGWELPAVIVPDPGAPGARQRLSTLLRGCPAVVGPTVPLAQLPDSAAVGRDALWLLDLAAGASTPFFVDEHLDTIIVHRDERLLNALRARCLAPLEGAARGSRAAFQDTLRSWLVHMGDRREVAAELHVHPQTVRYRLSRLHELFGPTLDDPRERLRLLLALAWDPPGRTSSSAGPGADGHADAAPDGAPPPAAVPEPRRTALSASPRR